MEVSTTRGRQGDVKSKKSNNVQGEAMKPQSCNGSINFTQPELTRRGFLAGTASIALGMGALGTGPVRASEEDVVVLGWTSYITPEIVAIMKKAGVNVRGVPAATDQDMFTKVKAGGAGSYDIVFANCGFSPTNYKAGLI